MTLTLNPSSNLWALYNKTQIQEEGDDLDSEDFVGLKESWC